MLEEHERMGFHEGWDKAIDQLEALAASLRALRNVRIVEILPRMGVRPTQRTRLTSLRGTRTAPIIVHAARAATPSRQPA